MDGMTCTRITRNTVHEIAQIWQIQIWQIHTTQCRIKAGWGPGASNNLVGALSVGFVKKSVGGSSKCIDPSRPVGRFMPARRSPFYTFSLSDETHDRGGGANRNFSQQAQAFILHFTVSQGRSHEFRITIKILLLLELPIFLLCVSWRPLFGGGPGAAAPPL